MSLLNSQEIVINENQTNLKYSHLTNKSQVKGLGDTLTLVSFEGDETLGLRMDGIGMAYKGVVYFLPGHQGSIIPCPVTASPAGFFNAKILKSPGFEVLLPIKALDFKNVSEEGEYIIYKFKADRVHESWKNKEFKVGPFKDKYKDKMYLWKKALRAHALRAHSGDEMHITLSTNGTEIKDHNPLDDFFKDDVVHIQTYSNGVNLTPYDDAEYAASNIKHDTRGGRHGGTKRRRRKTRTSKIRKRIRRSTVRARRTGRKRKSRRRKRSAK